jgi:Uncharacterised protein family (UPF0203)
MGSAQSSSNRNSPSHVSETGNHEDGEDQRHNTSHGANEDVDRIVASDPTSMEYHDPRRPDGGMPLVHYQCRKKKKSYDKCVKQWYSTDFLSGTGASLNQEEVCGDKFEVYRTCILKGVKREIWDKQNLPPPLEGSPLAEIIDDNDDKE